MSFQPLVSGDLKQCSISENSPLVVTASDPERCSPHDVNENSEHGERGALGRAPSGPVASFLFTGTADVSGPIPNIALDTYQSVVDSVQETPTLRRSMMRSSASGEKETAWERRSTRQPGCRRDRSPSLLYPPQVTALRNGSIYSLEAVAEVAQTRGIEAAEAFVKGPKAVFLQCIIFFTAVVVGAVNPLIYEAALWNPELQRKETAFIPGTLYVAYYGLSVLAGNVVSASVYGSKAWRECWNPRGLFFMLPAAAILALVETLDSVILQSIHSSIRMVITQLRLPLLALIGVFVLGRRQSAVQWMLVMGTTISVMGFFAASIRSMESAEVYGVWLCLLQSTIAAFGSTVSEVTLKTLKYPFCVQIAQARFLSLVVSVVGLAVYCFKFQCYERLYFHGWNSRIVGLVFWLCLRDWIQTFTLKILSALWKALASALAVCVTYVLQTLILQKAFDPILSSFILCVVVDIVGYTLTKRESKGKKLSGGPAGRN